MSEYIQNLKDSIKATHHCDSEHEETAIVHEMMDGKTVWEGKVEVFELSGHEKATKAFSWGYKDDRGEVQYISVLNVPPIDSPREAVQAAIKSGNFK